MIIEVHGLELFGRHGVEAAVQRDPAELDGDHVATTALATLSASTCSLTSCARRMVAPRS